MPRQEFLNSVDWMVRYPCQHLAQVGFRVKPVQLRRAEQAVKRCGPLPTGIRSSEQKILAPQGHHAFILPMSGKKLTFIIAGIRFTVDDCGCSAANNVRTVELSISR